MKKTFITLVICMTTIIFFMWCGLRVYNRIIFGIECGDRMKRAADANTIELATQEMKAVIAYADHKGLTQGYTSILYRTPDEDVGFWYANMKASLLELENLSMEATQLEKSNVLMKLRETLLDSGKDGQHITTPPGISIFPNNTAYAIWGGFIFLLMCFFLILLGIQVFKDDY